MAGPLRSILARFGFEFDTSGAEKAQHHLEHLIHGVETFGEALVGAKIVKEFAEFIHETIESAETLQKTADKLGIASDKLQVYQEAANLSGASSESLTAGLRRLAAAANGLDEGGGKAKNVFKEFGIELKDAAGKTKPLEELFQEVGGAIGGLGDNVKRAAAAQKFFGRGGIELLGIFKGGAEGAKKLFEEIEELGGGYSQELTEGAVEAVDAHKKLIFVMKALRSQIAVVFIPAIVFVNDKLRMLVQWINKAVAGTNFFRGIFLALGAVMAHFAAAIIAKFWPILRTFGLFAAKLIIIGLIIDDILTFLQGGESVIGKVIDALFGAGAAVKVVTELRGIWEDFTDNVVPNIGQTFSDLGDLIVGVFSTVKTWITDFTSWLGGAIWDLLPDRVQEVLTIMGAFFDAHIAGWVKAFDDFVGMVLDKINPLKDLLKDLFTSVDEKANAAARAEARARDASTPEAKKGAKAAGVSLKDFRAGAVDTFGGFHPAAVGAGGRSAGEAAANVVRRIPTPSGGVVEQHNETNITVHGVKDAKGVARETGHELRRVHSDERNAALAALEHH